MHLDAGDGTARLPGHLRCLYRESSRVSMVIITVALAQSLGTTMTNAVQPPSVDVEQCHALHEQADLWSWLTCAAQTYPHPAPVGHVTIPNMAIQPHDNPRLSCLKWNVLWSLAAWRDWSTPRLPSQPRYPGSRLLPGRPQLPNEDEHPEERNPV